jgi:hypothetical protein
MARGRARDLSSSGHKLGQLVGDWFEQYFVLPLMQSVARELRLYLDSRFRTRPARGDKIVWHDMDGHAVDYDFVMELGGTDSARGIPVAFVESFWRRGARHSRDKARDDCGKLLPMRDVHPTARFLGIVAGGEFTAPARAFVQQRQIELLYIPKGKIVEAFSSLGLTIDYPDQLGERQKADLAARCVAGLTVKKGERAATALRQLVGESSLRSYVDRVRAALAALPQEIRLMARQHSMPVVFERIEEATAFLSLPRFDFAAPSRSFVYEVTYSDGSEFARSVTTLDELRSLHTAIERLARHVST